MLDFGPGSFFLTPSQIADSPSFRHGVSAETEKALRIYACEMIQEACILLRLPQAVAATAQVILHRFFCKQSFRDFDARSAAASCFWLSLRLEEEKDVWNRGRKISCLNDVVCMFEHVRARREGTQPLTRHAPGFEARKEELLKLETRILVELGFFCHVEHPHKLMLSYLNCLEASKELIQESWNLVNDSLRTTLCVCSPSNVVACGIIYAAARRLCISLPENPPWWDLFDVTRGQIGSVVNVLADLYRQPKSRYIDVVKPVLVSISVSVASPVPTSIEPTEPQSCPRELTSNGAKYADVSCNNSAHEIFQPSVSKNLSCLMNESGCTSSNASARDKRRPDEPRLSARVCTKRSLESSVKADTSQQRSVFGRDEADEPRKGSTYMECSRHRHARKELVCKHRRRGEYDSCSRYYEHHSLSSSRSYWHVKG